MGIVHFVNLVHSFYALVVNMPTAWVTDTAGTWQWYTWQVLVVIT
jgi:hypothetical protein